MSGSAELSARVILAPTIKTKLTASSINDIGSDLKLALNILNTMYLVL